jgi:FlaA1/EpsC-like NDP-sugar epimerase
MALDAVAINLAVVLAFVVRFGWPIPEFNFSAYQAVFIPLTVLQLLVFFLVDLYEPAAERSGPELLGTVVKGVGLGVLLVMAVTFVLRQFAFPRSVLALTFITEIMLIWGWRRLAAGLLHVQWPERRIILVGSARDSLMVAERLHDVERWGYLGRGPISNGLRDSILCLRKWSGCDPTS